MATVLLLRHGRTQANATGLLAGRSPVPLDDTGRAQASAAAARLAGLPLRRVVSSPLPRCRETVALALPALPPDSVVEEPGLIECGYGAWSGRPLKELVKEPLWRVVQAHPSAATFPEGESMAAMSARAVAAIRAHDALLKPEELWLACTHGDIIKAIVADALGLHLDQFQRIAVDPASITVIRYTPARPFVLRLNDTAAPLASLVPPRKPRRSRGPAASVGTTGLPESDAVLGGGAGSPLPPSAS